MNSNPTPSWYSLSRYTRNILKGHPLACLWLGLTLVVTTLGLVVLAQRLSAETTTPMPTSDALAAGIALYQQGEFEAAQVLFAGIGPSDANYGIAQAYDALCRYALCRAAQTNDYRWFLDALASPAVQSAVLPSELREDLAFKEIDGLYQSGQFQSDKALGKIAAFQTTYPVSIHSGAMQECELAAWFDRGVRRVYKASLGKSAEFREIWTNGLAHLEQFVSRAGAFPADDYATLGDRSLAEDLAVALALLAEEPAGLGQIAVPDMERRERYGLLRVALHQKRHPAAWTQNLQWLADFQTQLQSDPPSPGRTRVAYGLARFAFRAGERLCQETAGALPGEVEAVAAKRAAASQYFATVRALDGGAGTDAAAGVEPSDRVWLRQVALASFYYEHDYDGLRAAAGAQLTNSTPGDVNWLMAKVFTGIVLHREIPAQRAAAVAAWEEVLGYGFRNEHDHDGMVLEAVNWRMHAALVAGDAAKVRALFDWVTQSDCEGKAKANFLEDRRDYAAAVGWPEMN